MSAVDELDKLRTAVEEATSDWNTEDGKLVGFRGEIANFEAQKKEAEAELA